MLSMRRLNRTGRGGEPELPAAPPLAVRETYLHLSWSYVRWCTGMLVWSLLCVFYFILTRQLLELAIGICLGILATTMIVFPAAFFGGSTWHKRLAWMTVLTAMLSVMFLYPLMVAALGIWHRAAEGRYLPWPSLNDLLHLVLCALTLAMAGWTGWVAGQAVRLVRTLQRGDYAGST